MNVEDTGIVRVDLADFSYEETGIPTTATALGYGGDGYHYANGGPLEANVLYQVDVGAVGTVPVMIGAGSRAIEDLDADDSGTLYGVGEGWLFTIDPGTGQQSDLAPLGFDCSALAFDPEIQLFYVADGTDLLSLDPSTMGLTYLRDLEAIPTDFGGPSSQPSGVGSVTPASERLSWNSPNPFGPSTTISFDIPRDASVDLKIFDVRGRVVETLLGGEKLRAGPSKVHWFGTDHRGRTLGAGTYYYRLQWESSVETGRMTLVR